MGIGFDALFVWWKMDRSIKTKYKIRFKYVYEQAIKVFEKLIVEEKCQIVLYPNGEITRFVKDFLKEKYNIDVQYVIDNKKYNGKDILNLEQAARKDNSNIYFIICSDNAMYYKEIRENIYKYFNKKQIIDMFPNNELESIPSDDEIRKVLMMIDEFIPSESNKNAYN